ncbi:hypothetical protein D3C72_1099900 [compost metagenome]
MTRLAFILLLASVMLTACQPGGGHTEAAQIIDHSINTIINDKQIAMSSNPNEYIATHQEAYDQIIGQGDAGLKYLVQELKNSDDNGLKAWIMAKASSDILGGASPVKDWSTAQEWVTQYERAQ